MSANFRSLPSRLRRGQAQFHNCIERAMLEAMRLGVDTGRDVIETSGTDQEWSRPWGGRSGGGRGRVDTRKMVDEFGAEVDIGNGVVTGKLGWVREKEDYFFYQDQGFWHVLSQREIEGMYALRNAGQEAWEHLRAESEKCLRQLTRGGFR